MVKFVDVNVDSKKSNVSDLKTMEFEELQSLFREVSIEVVKDGKTINELFRV